ncbi:MAG: phosphoribosylformylglycinamidine cyclo-ligase [Desulfovibrionaceae bacterium]|nr:phosphoribosylformylglycinamidine cyclo-ligase [Desulfovibrionaceae bacterium]
MDDRASAYRSAGVDIDAANAFIGRIKGLVATTFTKGVITDIGGFGGLFKPDLSQVKEPVLVAGTDGVGTKLKLAFAFNRHASIGQDLVAMSANDVLVQGAKPLFFLDYFATGRLDAEVAEQVIAGVVEGCKQARCALLGGETAEMPGFYADGEYDLSGFCVGLVDNDRIVDGSRVTIGDQLIGLASSGLHSNGYSLVRKLFEASNLGPDDELPGCGAPAAEVLMAPTRIYVQPVLGLLRDLEIKGMVHVTGGGFYDNLPRVLPEAVCAQVDFGSWPVPPVFNWLKAQGAMAWPEMLQVFNCGVGYVIIAAAASAEEIIGRLGAMGVEAWVIGRAIKRVQGLERVEVGF